MKFTILGANGFVGSALAKYLIDCGDQVHLLERSQSSWMEKILNHHLGTVFYCVGLTADFRKKPHETVEAHVCLLNQVLQKAQMDKLIYLSSTRIYECMQSTQELMPVLSDPNQSGHLYNLSKLMGESICLHGRRDAAVVRLSNVYGDGMKSENFLSAVLKEAATKNRVELQTSASSSKDFIHINDVVSYLRKIAVSGKHEIYNLASGRNTSNAEIAEVLMAQGINVYYSKETSTWSMPQIEVSRLESEFGGVRYNLLNDLPQLLKTTIN
jgi:nucleoside-diphosphate-sugar epimerase